MEFRREGAAAAIQAAERIVLAARGVTACFTGTAVVAVVATRPATLVRQAGPGDGPPLVIPIRRIPLGAYVAFVVVGLALVVGVLLR